MPHTFVAGDNFATATFQCDGLRRHPVITCGLRSETPTTAAVNIAQWRDALIVDPGPYDPAVMSAHWRIIAMSMVSMTGGGVLTRADLTLNSVGTSSTLDNTPSPNTSVVIAKNTGEAGRKNRGRFFSPPCGIGEANIDQAGVIGSTQVTTLNGKFGHLFDTLVDADLTPAILHDDAVGGGFTLCTSFSVTPLVGTNRRRIR